MAEKSLTELYEIGDTSADIVNDLPGAKAQVIHDESPDARPRGPDGKFLPSPPKHNPQTLRLARDLGFTDDDINGKAPDVLDEIVYHANRQNLRRQAEMSQAAGRERTVERRPESFQTSEAVVTQNPPREGGSDRVETPERSAAGSDDYFDGINREDYDGPLIKLIERLASEVKELKAAAAEAKVAVNHVKAQAQETVNDRIDKAFAAFEGIVGKGGVRDLKPDSTEMKRRLHILKVAEGQEGVTEADKINAAMKLIYDVSPGQPQKAPETTDSGPQIVRPANGRPTVEEWQEGGLQRTTNRQAAEPKGESKAVATAARIMREMELAGGTGDTDINGFPA